MDDMNRTRRTLVTIIVAVVANALVAVGPAGAGGSTEQNEILVLRSYSDVLQRSPESPAFETWVSELDGGLPRTSYALALLQSGEFHELLVDEFYGIYLERAADPGGIAGFAPLIDGGSSWEHVQSLILASDEFFTNVGGTDENFVSALYFVVLEREPDEAGLHAFVEALAEGWSRQQVADAFVLSPEGRSVLIAGMYESFLGRAVDGDSLAVWITTPYETVLAAIIASDEYYNLPVKA
jgi:hypothetical protein